MKDRTSQSQHHHKDGGVGLSIKTSGGKFYIIDKGTELIIAEFRTLKEAVQFTKEFRKLEKETERTRDGSAYSQWKWLL